MKTMTRSRYLIATTEQPRVRRAVDVTRVAISLLMVFGSWRAYTQVEDVDASVVKITEWIPGWLSGTLPVVYGFAGLYAIGLLIEC